MLNIMHFRNFVEECRSDTASIVTLYCPGTIRRYSCTAVMTIKESLNIALRYRYHLEEVSNVR
jgi:hypothetical protein